MRPCAWPNWMQTPAAAARARKGRSRQRSSRTASSRNLRREPDAAECGEEEVVAQARLAAYLFIRLAIGGDGEHRVLDCRHLGDGDRYRAPDVDFLNRRKVVECDADE